MAVKLSELKQGDTINVDGEIYTLEQVKKMIEKGDKLPVIYTVSDNWIQGALNNAFISSGGSDVYTAPDPDAELIEIDL